MADLCGQQIGHHRLIRLLGQGSSAEIYLAEHVDLLSLAAVKLWQNNLPEPVRDRFLSEVKLLSHLNHPHITRLLDYGIQDGVAYFIMEYAPLGTLHMRHPRGSRVELSTVVHYVEQIASALSYAHESRIIHRDLKPENLLLRTEEELLLSDFGLATEIQQYPHSANTTTLSGTLAYMAPETFGGKSLLASDQYALGVLVYEWLTGELPFRGGAAQVCYQHLYVPPPSLREGLPSLPQLVEGVVLTALAKEPRSRFPDVKAFAEALALAAKGAPEEPFQSHSPSSSLRACLRQPKRG